MTKKTLTAEEYRIIIDKGTEAPFSGEYNDHRYQGMYCCKQCHAPLYLSEHKFISQCGWPSFDDEIKGAIKRQPDADGSRVEIVCNGCNGHLGHVFEGEYLTANNIRHCVNSLSMQFVSESDLEGLLAQPHKAYFAGGCFWGVEHLMQQKEGVLHVASGYMGGALEKPTYAAVCNKDTGHLEVVEITYDSSKVTYEALLKLFFEIHDPTQADGQGPDIGPQYLSAIFYSTEQEREVAKKVIKQLEHMGMTIITKLDKASKFWKAEEYHQDYYEKNGQVPYCHAYKKLFSD
jgi:peptide methionine sulfoxide reductase msrA/msrB